MTKYVRLPIGLTYKRFEVAVTLPQGIVTERGRELSEARHLCIVALIV